MVSFRPIPAPLRNGGAITSRHTRMEVIATSFLSPFVGAYEVESTCF